MFDGASTRRLTIDYSLYSNLTTVMRTVCACGKTSRRDVSTSSVISTEGQEIEELRRRDKKNLDGEASAAFHATKGE